MKPANLSVAVRDATPADARRIARWNTLLADESEGVRLDAATILAGVQAVLEDDAKGRYFVAEWNRQPVGTLMITYEWSDWRNGVFFWIQSVYVEKDFRSRGVFTALFEHVRKVAEESHSCGLRLYVHAENSGAREVYARRGLVSHDYLVLETPDLLR